MNGVSEYIKGFQKKVYVCDELTVFKKGASLLKGPNSLLALKLIRHG